MKLEVTYHPISLKELRYLVLDIFEQPRLALERVVQITAHTRDQKYLLQNIYSHFPNFRSELRAGRCGLANTVGYSAATIAGFLHPYWYGGHTPLSNLGDCSIYFSLFYKSIFQMFPAVFNGMLDDSCGRIYENFVSGGYVEFEKVRELNVGLKSDKHRSIAMNMLGTEALEALEALIDYCLMNELGFLEATDVFIPDTGETPSNPKHFRAGFLRNLRDFSNSRGLCIRPASSAECEKYLGLYTAYLRNGVYDMDISRVAIKELRSETVNFLATHCKGAKKTLAASADTPAEVLELLYKTSDPVVLKLLAANQSTPVDILEALSTHESIDIQSCVAANPSTPVAILQVYLRSSSRLRKAAKRNPSLSGRNN